ncbi:hypothetical protein Nepgr_000580 [Nepenthes gracilis]|uniref:Nal1 C-terminal domain-containing protein n=1 Tax=Nepenthes gracilis TaxID=150966 RepID=A0AAD3P3D8_NEPGR|nr:hypothetical protein Nepgr_000580 [Nepenthes gracilis]
MRDREGAKPKKTDDALFVLLVKPGYDKLIQVEASRRDFPNSGGITCEPRVLRLQAQRPMWKSYTLHRTRMERSHGQRGLYGVEQQIVAELKLKIGQPQENRTSGVDLGRLVDLLELDLITTREGLRARCARANKSFKKSANPTMGESSPHAKDKVKRT